MRTEYEYIRFVEIPHGPERKTPIFEVVNIAHHTTIGHVQRDGGWRQFVMRPAAATIWSAGCLADVEDFIRGAMKARA